MPVGRAHHQPRRRVVHQRHRRREPRPEKRHRLPLVAGEALAGEDAPRGRRQQRLQRQRPRRRRRAPRGRLGHRDGDQRGLGGDADPAQRVRQPRQRRGLGPLDQRPHRARRVEAQEAPRVVLPAAQAGEVAQVVAQRRDGRVAPHQHPGPGVPQVPGRLAPGEQPPHEARPRLQAHQPRRRVRQRLGGVAGVEDAVLQARALQHLRQAGHRGRIEQREAGRTGAVGQRAEQRVVQPLRQVRPARPGRQGLDRDLRRGPARRRARAPGAVRALRPVGPMPVLAALHRTLRSVAPDPCHAGPAASTAARP